MNTAIIIMNLFVGIITFISFLNTKNIEELLISLMTIIVITSRIEIIELKRKKPFENINIRNKKWK